MPNLPGFADFLAATRDVKVTSKDTLLNEATKNTYFIAEMLKGRGVDKSFKGGSKLVEKIDSGTNNSFGFYSPNDEESPTQSDSLKTVEVNWSFARSYYSFTDETTELNAGDPNAYIDLKKALEQRCIVDTLNGMETQLWTSPNSDEMESVAADPKKAYSIPCFVTRDGGVPSSSNGGIADGSTAWTTLETINPTNEDWFTNKFNTYDPALPDDPDAGLINQFDDIVLQTKFEMPDALRKYSEQDNLRKYVIATSRDGITFYKARLRALNDRMDMLKDPAISGPQYQGIPLKYVSELDDAGWTDNQPDYLFLNLNVLFPVFHTKWFMKEKMTDGGSKQPNSHVVWKFSWYNIFCRSRRRQGRVSAA